MEQPVITTSHFGMSQDIGALAKAVAIAQGRMDTARKRATNPAFKRPGSEGSSYADLEDIISACKGPLADAGVARFQLVLTRSGEVGMRTMLVHESGQYLWSEAYVACAAGAQQLGSATTYLQRYTLRAAVGLAVGEDDDGNAAQGRPVTTTVAAPPPPPAQNTVQGTEREARMTEIRARVGELGWTPVEAVELMQKHFQKNRMADLDVGEVNLMLALVQEHQRKKATGEAA